MQGQASNKLWQWLFLKSDFSRDSHIQLHLYHLEHLANPLILFHFTCLGGRLVGCVLKNLHLYEAPRVLLKLALVTSRYCEGDMPEAEWIDICREGIPVWPEGLLPPLPPPAPTYFHSLCKGYLVSEVSVTCWSVPPMAAGELCHIPKFFPTVLSLLHLNSKKGCRAAGREKPEWHSPAATLGRANQNCWAPEHHSW